MACETPLILAKKGEIYSGKLYNKGLEVPCTKCVPCKKRRIQDWVFRMMQEEKVSSSSFFVTLTYDEQHLPYTKCKYPTLKISDIQNFIKRLRKLNIIAYKKYKYFKTPESKRQSTYRIDCINKPIRYYAVGEYAPLHKRPHYHLIIFNLENENSIPIAWTCPISRVLIGNVHCGQVTQQSITYTTKYIDKERKVPIHIYDKRTPEFSNMSQGLGRHYHLNKEIQAYHQEDIKRLCATYPDGKQVALPRYYRKKLYTEEQQLEQIPYIVKKVKENDKKEKLTFEKTYRKTDYDYTTYKWDKKIGEYQTYYYKAKNSRKLDTPTRIHSTHTEEEKSKTKGQLQVLNKHRRASLDFTEYDSPRPITNNSRNTAKTHKGTNSPRKQYPI